MSLEVDRVGVDGAELRARNVPQYEPSAEQAKEAVQELNAEEYYSEKASKDKKTFGRTPNGTSRSEVRTLDLISVRQRSACPPHSR